MTTPAREFEAHWQADGSAHERAPLWAKYRSDMQKGFPSPYREANDPLAQGVSEAIRLLDELRPERVGPGFLGNDPTLHWENVKDAAIPQTMDTARNVIQSAVKMFEGLPQWGHPLTMPNVIPQPNVAAIVAAMLTEVFSPNNIEGEYAWNVHRAELEVSAMLARLIGWNPEVAGGIFTYGGSGCYIYGMKHALTRVLGRDSRYQGIRTDAKLISSQQGHYTKLNASDWTGLGSNNIIHIETETRTNAMDLRHLEQVLRDLHTKGIPTAAIVCTMGTTDANAFDPVAEVRELVEKYRNPAGYGNTFVYCDAVIGWAWLFFGNYDFNRNPLGFSEEVLPYLERNYQAVKGVVHADGIGIDFHKSGWAPYASSIYMTPNLPEFQQLMSRPGSVYLQERTPYNPGDFTLEASRACTGSVAAWASLKFLGYEGYQSILGGIGEMKAYLRQLLAETPEVTCVNLDDYGLVTLFRVYPKGVDAKAQFEKESQDHSVRNELIRHNRLQGAVADKMWEWFRSARQIDGGYTPYISYNTGFRPADYNRDYKDPEAVIYSLKSFPMNVHVTPQTMRRVIEVVLAARDEVTATGRFDTRPLHATSRW